MKKILALTTLILITLQIFAQKQEIHWATQVDTVTSEYSYDRYGAKEVLGKPNVDKQGRNSTFAWAVEANEVNKEIVEMAYVEVSFEQSHFVQQLAVFESFNPGAISEIYISSFRKPKTPDESLWEKVYTDTSVIRRTGIPKINGQIDESLKDIAGKKGRDMNVFAKDSVFQAQKGYDIKNIFFSPRDVRRVRVVLNPLAIDGWNQIDAIGMCNSSDSIKYPEPTLADQSIIIDRKSENLGERINTKESELYPVLSPDEKRLYFAKKEYQNGMFTQNIWYTDLNNEKIYSCNKFRKNNYEEQDLWQTSEPIYWEFNNVVPNTVVGFSANGEYMYLNNLYNVDSCNCDETFLENTTGLSVSHLDTIEWYEEPNPKIDSISLTRFSNFYVDEARNILISTKFDSLTMQNFVYVQKINKKDEWGKHHNLGEIKNSPFSFFAEIEGKDRNFWINVDSINPTKAVVKGLKWGQPAPVKIDDYKNQSNYTSFYISPDGEKMFMALQEDTTETFGRDIYISFLNNDGKTWGKPHNLGTTINTISDESSPFIDGDGYSLYFSSAGHEGYGEHDVFISERLDDSWLNWSEPRNLGNRVNTPGSDVNFRIGEESRMGYFTGYEKSVGCNDRSDIFQIQMGKPITIHIKGVTRNVNNNYQPIGDVQVAMKALVNEKPDGFRRIEFKSSQYTGEYDIKITKMVEANKMTEFGILATKENCYQTDYDKNAINYEYINLTNPDWTVNIHQDLYLYGPKRSDIIGPPAKVDTVFVYTEPDIEYRGDTVVIKEVEIIRDTVELYGEIEIKAEGCPLIFSAGQIYGLETMEDGKTRTLKKLTMSYSKYFAFNEKDISLNETDFKKLSDDLLYMLKNTKNKVTVYILSSASKVPTTAYASNFELARLRAEEPEKRLIQVMKNNNFPVERVNFEKKYVVDGDEYENDAYNEDKNYNLHQYVKIWLYSCDDD